MGEYAIRKSDQAEIKIGTCESMYYLRWEDIDKVQINYNLREPGLWFRLPLPKEDGIEPGSYDGHRALVRLMPYPDPDNERQTIAFSLEDPTPGRFQMHHPSGLLLGVPCYHGAHLPDVAVGWSACWNGKDPHPWELLMVKNTEEGLLPIVSCRHCRDTYRTSWANVLPHVLDPVLRERLTAYANQSPA
jgi:hypothetical protein